MTKQYTGYYHCSEKAARRGQKQRDILSHPQLVTLQIILLYYYYCFVNEMSENGENAVVTLSPNVLLCTTNSPKNETYSGYNQITALIRHI